MNFQKNHMKKQNRIICLYHKNDTMTTDSALAFEKNGCHVLHIILKENKQGLISFEPVKIIKQTLNFKPDIIFFLNSFGQDKECNLLKAFSILKIKTVSWFIDNPFYYKTHIDNMSTLNNFFCFSWDSFYIPLLKNINITNTFYLPQATNPERFQSSYVITKDEEKDFKHKITFAGNLDLNVLNSILSKTLTKTTLPDNIIYLIIEECSKQVLAKQDTATFEIIDNYLKINNLDKELSQHTYSLAKIIEYKLSIFFRVELAKALKNMPFAIWGEKKDWEKVISKVPLLGRVSYFKNIPKVYKGSEINLNISRTQQRYGTNQRVFDVPACKSFLISDYKKELEDLFDIGKEIIVFHDMQDLKNKLIYYSDEKKRLPVIEDGFSRIMNNHTYRHRMQEVLKITRTHKLIPENLNDDKNFQAMLWIASAFIERKEIPQALNYLKIIGKKAKYATIVSDLLTKYNL